MTGRLIVVAWAVAAAGFDARRRRLPNWLTLGGLVGGGVYALITGTSLLGAGSNNAFLSAAIGFLALYPSYLAGWMGAGDVKLFAAMGMLGGGRVLLPTLLAGSIISGVLALMLVMMDKGRARGKQERPLPFGVGLAVGFALTVLDMLPMLAWKG